jgi:hypothetical protein
MHRTATEPAMIIAAVVAKREGRLMSRIVQPDGASKRQRTVAIRVVFATSVEDAKVAALNSSQRAQQTARNHNPLVGGLNPPAATIQAVDIDRIFSRAAVASPEVSGC